MAHAKPPPDTNTFHPCFCRALSDLCFTYQVKFMKCLSLWLWNLAHLCYFLFVILLLAVGLETHHKSLKQAFKNKSREEEKGVGISYEPRCEPLKLIRCLIGAHAWMQQTSRTCLPPSDNTHLGSKFIPITNDPGITVFQTSPSL